MLHVRPSTEQFVPLTQHLSPKATAPREFRLGDVTALLRRAAGPMLMSVAALLGVAIVYVMTATPRYVASVQLLIEAQRPQVALWAEPGMLDLTLDTAQVENQIEILRSESISKSVIDELNLVADPEFQPPAGFAATPEHAARWMIGYFGQRLNVRRIGQSYVIDLSFSSASPERSAQIANAVASSYIRDQIDLKVQSVRRGSEWLQERIAEMQGQVEASARAVELFKAKKSIISTDGKNLLDTQLSEVSTQLIVARGRTADAEARYARVKQIDLQHYSGASLTEAITSPVYTNLQQRWQTDATRVAELTQRYGAKHDAVKREQAEMRVLETAMSAELKRIGESYLSEFQIATAREKAMSAELDRLVQSTDDRRGAMVSLSELESRAQSDKRVYESLLQKMTESVQKETLPTSSARIIAPAVTPLARSTPKTTLTLALAGISGLILGLAISGVRHTLDHSLRSAQAVRSLGLPCLGLVPQLKTSQLDRSGETPLARLTNAPTSGFAESMRDVKSSLDVLNSRHTLGTLGVVSLKSHEGKSTIAFNLATLFARSGARTLLIDADYRTSSLSATLAPAARSGLTEAMRGTGIVPAVDPESGLHFLPLGSRPGFATSSDLLASNKLRVLLEVLRSDYDHIVLDLPALASAADGRAAAGFTDGSILVAEWGKTRAEDVSEAVEYLGTGRGNVIGIVLNRSDPNVRLVGRISSEAIGAGTWFGGTRGLLAKQA